MLKYIKRFFIVLFFICLIIYCFKGFLYRNLIKYKGISQRELVKIEDNNIKKDLDFWLITNKNSTIEQIIDFAENYAIDNVKYTFSKCSINPNQVIRHDKKTNCIGYSASLNMVISYLLDKKGLSSKVKSEHKVGQLYFLGYNIHHLFKDPAFRDHDYNVITDYTEGGKKYVIDPTVWVNLGIDSISEK